MRSGSCSSFSFTSCSVLGPQLFAEQTASQMSGTRTAYPISPRTFFLHFVTIRGQDKAAGIERLIKVLIFSMEYMVRYMVVPDAQVHGLEKASRCVHVLDVYGYRAPARHALKQFTAEPPGKTNMFCTRMAKLSNACSRGQDHLRLPSQAKPPPPKHSEGWYP